MQSKSHLSLTFSIFELLYKVCPNNSYFSLSKFKVAVVVMDYKRTLGCLLLVTCWIVNASALGNRNAMNNYVNILNEMQRENNRTLIEPPPHELLAKMARYIVHKSGKNTIDHEKKTNSSSFKSTN